MAVCVMVVTGTPWVLAAENPVLGEVRASAPIARPATLDTVDVVLQPGGVLRGRIVTAEPDPFRGTTTPRQVTLVSAGRTVARTLADSEGRFAMRRLSPGVAALVVAGPRGVHQQPCRLWTTEAAPPASVAEVHVCEAAPTIRAQFGLVRMGFPKALGVAGIVAGAIAVPVIYHDIQRANEPPHSP